MSYNFAAILNVVIGGLCVVVGRPLDNLIVI